MPLPTSLAEAKQMARVSLQDLGADLRDDDRIEGSASAEWQAGLRLELFGCWLRCVYFQVERPSTNIEFIRNYVAAMAPIAARRARPPLTRCLALAVVVTDEATADVETDLGSCQVLRRGYVSPLVVDLGSHRILAPRIDSRGLGFSPYRQKIISTIFPGPLTLIGPTGPSTAVG